MDSGGTATKRKAEDEDGGDELEAGWPAGSPTGPREVVRVNLLLT